MGASRKLRRTTKQRADTNKRIASRAKRRDEGLKRLEAVEDRKEAKRQETARREALSPAERQSEDDAHREQIERSPLYQAALHSIRHALHALSD